MVGQNNIDRRAEGEGEVGITMCLCQYAVMGVGGWECSGYPKVLCEFQVKDYNPDGTVNVVECTESEDE